VHGLTLVLFDHASGRTRAIVVEGRAIFRVAETFGIGETNTPALANAILASASDCIRINRVGTDCTGFSLDLNGIGVSTSGKHLQTENVTDTDKDASLGDKELGAYIDVEFVPVPASTSALAPVPAVDISEFDPVLGTTVSPKATAPVPVPMPMSEGKDEKILHEETRVQSEPHFLVTPLQVSVGRVQPQRSLIPSTTNLSDIICLQTHISNPSFFHDGRRGAVRANSTISRLMLAKKLLADRGKGVG